MKTNEGGAAFGAIGKERSKLLAMIMVLAILVVGMSIVIADRSDDVSAVSNTMPEPSDDGKITLTEDVVLTSAYTVPSGVTEIDLGGYTVSSSVVDYMITISNGENVSINNGTLKSTVAGVRAYGDVTLGDKLTVHVTTNANAALLVIGSTATINGAALISEVGYGIVLFNSNIDNTQDSISPKLIVNNGSVECDYFAISTNNIQSAGSTIDINGGEFTTESGVVMYYPAESTITIDKATLTGPGGIEIKMGSLTITDTTINATGEYVPGYPPANGGSSPNGSAIVVSAHQYGNSEGQYLQSPDVTVTINEGTVLNSTNGDSIDVFNMGTNPTKVQNITVDINVEVESVRVANGPDTDQEHDVTVNIASTESVQIDGYASINIEGPSSSGSTEIEGKVVSDLTVGDVDLIIPGGKSLSIEGTITSDESTSFTLGEGSSLSVSGSNTIHGSVITGNGSSMSGSITAGDDGLTFTDGPLNLSGSGWTGSVTALGDVSFSGDMVSGASITIQPNGSVKSTVTWMDFNQNDSTIQYQNSDGTEANAETVSDQRYGGNTGLDGITITTDYGNGRDSYIYDGSAFRPPTITVMHSTGTVSPSGFLRELRDGETFQEGLDIQSGDNQYRFVASGNVDIYQNGEIVLEAKNAGTYTVLFGYWIDSISYIIECDWVISPAEVTIDFSEISKIYDGTNLAESGDVTIDIPELDSSATSALVSDGAVYSDSDVGSWVVSVPFSGDLLSNYVFIVNGDEVNPVEGAVEIYNYGVITAMEITLSAPEDTSGEYSGNRLKIGFDELSEGYPITEGAIAEGHTFDGFFITTGTDRGEYRNVYSGSTLQSVGVQYYIEIKDMDGNDVTSNYSITLDHDIVLTIVPKVIVATPAPGADITKVYNGYGSRIMDVDNDFQLSGVIGEDDVSLHLTQDASLIRYNSVNVDEANELTVEGLSLEGKDADNYTLESDTVVFVNGNNGVNVGITPFTLDFSDTGSANIVMGYNGETAVPDGIITSGEDFTFTTAQNGPSPTVRITSAYYNDANAGDNKTVYITGIALDDNDHDNFALPVIQEGEHFFSITGANVKINPITVDGNMVKGSYSEQDGKIILTVTVKSEDLEDLELTDFGSTLKFGEETIDAIEGTNSYIIYKSGRYTATVTSNDDNWIASNVEAPVDVDFDYTANFFTQTTLNGEYILELTVSFENGMVHTPAATNVPEGYELVGWRTADGIEYGVGEYAPVSAIGTDFYAVYEEIGGSTPEPSGPTVTIDIPDEFPIGTEIEFTVSTTAGNYTGGNVQGTGIFEGIPGVDYNIWYWEVQDDSWHEWISGNFGPEGGFPLIDATSKFKIQFINAGTYDLTVQIVTVSDNGVVCETSAVVDVPAENSLGYHVLDALDYVYADGGEYNADAYSYIAEFDADADSIIATYGHEYFEALIAYITNTQTDEQADMAEDVMNDFARYMGALYRSSDGDVGRVYFNGTEYVWKAATDGKWLNGCNWRDENGVTLTSAVVDYIESTQSTGIIMEIAVPGGDRQVLTYSAVFEDAPTPDIQYYNVTLAASEGVQFYVLDGSIVVAGTYSVAEGAHTISAVAADGWQFTGGVPAFNGAENGQFEVVDEDVTISVSNVEIVEESLEYTVKFSYQLVDGTTIETDQPKSMTVYFLRDQVPTVVLPVPTIDGYTFVGWYGSDGAYFSGGGQVVLTSTETSLTARFIQMATYTVVFSGEGGQTYSNVAIGDAVVAPEVEVAEGYMAYWATENGFIVDLGERYYLSSMDVGENNTVIFTLVTEKIPEDPTYTITIPTGTGYTSMSETISGIVSGQDRTFTINPTAGYAIRAVNATYDEGGDVTINSYQNGESWIVTIYGITGDVTITVTVEQKDVVDGVFVEADYAPNGASVTLSPVSSGDDGILPNGTITVFYTYRTTVTIDGVQYEGNTTGSFTAVEYTNDDGSSIDHVSVTGDYPESTIRGYAVFTDEEGNSYYSTFFTVNVLSEAGE